jgi:hypothetical protein
LTTWRAAPLLLALGDDLLRENGDIADRDVTLAVLIARERPARVAD